MLSPLLTLLLQLHSNNECDRTRYQAILCTCHEVRLDCGLSLTYVTGLARVSRRTGAVVLVGLGVHAGSSVQTGMVAAAVVQIWRQIQRGN